MTHQPDGTMVAVNTVLAVFPAVIVLVTGASVEYALLTSIFVMVYSIMARQSKPDPQ